MDYALALAIVLGTILSAAQGKMSVLGVFLAAWIILTIWVFANSRELSKRGAVWSAPPGQYTRTFWLLKR